MNSGPSAMDVMMYLALSIGKIAEALWYIVALVSTMLCVDLAALVVLIRRKP